MKGTPFESSRQLYPGLPFEILAFFERKNATVDEQGLHAKTVGNFFSEFAKKNGQKTISPRTIVEICSKLEAQGWLSKVSSGGVMGIDNRYICTIRDDIDQLDASIGRLISCAVYGFPAVYESYRGSVIPIINWDQFEDQQIGTCFKINRFTVGTALHCVQPAAALAIRDINPDDLAQAAIYKHPNESLDLALICFRVNILENSHSIPLIEESADVLDEVMALGYPNVPGFHPTLAAESASIAGRLTASRGRIASQSAEIFSQAKLFLITARVRGGFSGGPILDTYGQCVGVVSREPAAESSSEAGVRYDDLGYGTAIPAEGLREMRALIDAGDLQPIDMPDVEFRSFV